ncbi:hypothetical protein [Flavobacterium sp. N502540]|uniref:hypothetical protein n=1 Tax=Flavobacterium sp. N502540 TaxID=2986838 RepID=UPI0022244090|nr:hypothetical protein [Flavobacterium sp. N502540]
MIEQEFFIDILKIMPTNAVCYLQAPNLSSINLLNKLKQSDLVYFSVLELNESNLQLIINCILEEDIQDDVQTIEIRYENYLLFEGFDRVQYGTVSNKLKLRDDFLNKYINDDLCNISTIW